MKPCFVNTENYKRFLAGLLTMRDRGAAEACILVVDGEPGLGKTTIVSRWVTQNDCVYMRAKEQWTAGWVLRDLLETLRETPEYSYEKMFKQALRALSARSRTAHNEGSTFAVVVDEADHFCSRREIMETLRDLSDMLEIPFVLVGMGRIQKNLTRFKQIASRCSPPVEFVPCPLTDVTALVNGLSEVPVADDLIKFLHKVSGGYTREIKEGIAAIERFGKRHSGHQISCAMMEGQILLNDRKTGRPITVRVEI